MSDNNKRIAKNTLFLYIRMFLIMGVTLFTSRVILQTLGVKDFGIYNVVAGIVVLFSFINNAMAIASQRFLSFALGENNDVEVKKVFCMSLTSHMVISLLILILSETLGLFILNGMNFPVDRLEAVRYTYHIAVVTCCISIIRVPYNAVIIAYEKMSFYAWISIIEAALKLLIAGLLVLHHGDRLIYYSILLLVVTIVITITYKLYCTHKFSTIKYQFYWNPSLLKEFLGFSGWSLAGSLANVGAQQGLNMIINLFCGVVVNAAVGISNQVMSAVMQFLTSFQTAFNPQLVKSYATGDREYFMNLIFKSSKFSYYLMFLISFPILLNCEYFLTLWLHDVPEYANEFSQLMIIFLLFDAISGPLWISVQATGKIKQYQLLMSCLILSNLPLAILLLYFHFSPVYVFLGRVIINIITLFVRIIYIRPLINLSVLLYLKKVLLVIVYVTILSLPLPLFLTFELDKNFFNVFLTSIISIVNCLISIYFIGLTSGEKLFLRSIIKNKF